MSEGLALAQQLEQYTSLAIFVVAAALATLSAFAWRREREQRLLMVAAAYVLFAVYGLAVFLEYALLTYLAPEIVELVEHGGAVLLLVGLLTFFLAIARS